MGPEAYFEGLTFLVIQHLLGIIIPGPCMAFIIKNSIESRKKGLLTVLGASFGSLSVKTLSLLGLAFVLVKFPLAFNIFKIAGGLYLLFLGFNAFLAAWNNWHHYKKGTALQDIPLPSAPILKLFKNLTNPFLMGYLISFSNPMSSLRFIAIFATAISPAMPFILQLSYLLVLCIVSIITFGIIALIFSEDKIQNVLRRYRFVIDLLIAPTMLYWAIKVFSVSLS